MTNRPIDFVLLAVILLCCAAPAAASADCDSDWDTTIPASEWSRLDKPEYVLCYPRGSHREQAEQWVDRALEVGWRKYGVDIVRDIDRRLVVFLPDRETNVVWSGTEGRYGWYGHWDHAELHVLMEGSNRGGLNHRSLEDYNSKNLVHETMHHVHQGMADRPADDWMRESLAEYDALMNSTESNRAHGAPRLIHYVRNYHADRIGFGQTLERDETLFVSSVYRAGPVFVWYMGSRFGPSHGWGNVHADLYRNGIDAVAARHGVTVRDLFYDFRTWFWAQPAEPIE